MIRNRYVAWVVALLIGSILSVPQVVTAKRCCSCTENAVFKVDKENPPTPSIGLINHMVDHGWSVADLAMKGTNRHFVHTFSNLPTESMQGCLKIRMKPNGEGSENDTMRLYLRDEYGNYVENTPNWSANIGKYGNKTGLLREPWNKENYPEAVDLRVCTNMLLKEMNAHGFVDLHVQNNTTVYSVELMLAPDLESCK